MSGEAVTAPVEPTHYCRACDDAEVSRRGALCGDCWEKAEDEREHEGEGLFDTLEEAMGEV